MSALRLTLLLAIGLVLPGCSLIGGFMHREPAVDAGPSLPNDCSTFALGDRENLGSCVNSEYPDIVPIISPDGRMLYFDRKRSPDNTGGTADNDEIYVSTRQSDGSWGPARNIGAPLNTRAANFVASALPDGNTLLVGNTYNADGTGGPGVSITHRTRDGWSFPEALQIADFENRNGYVSYSLANDGVSLLMSIEADGTLGDRDLYVSFLQDDGSWSRPLHLGATVNTAETESSPFLAADNETLYFSSEGHDSMGAYDVFVTRRLDDTWTRWSEPENLGPTINTTASEAGFVIPARGDYAYFGSSVEGGYGSVDIVRVALPEAAKPDPVVLVRGRTLDRETGRPVEATVTYEALAGTARGRAYSNPETGEYQIVLPAGARYGFRASATGYYSESVSLDLSDLAAYDEREQDLTLAPLAVGTKVRLNNLFFDTAQATLRSESRAELDRLAAFLRDNPSITLEIGGHTDSEGSDASNQRLSERRAQSVVDFLTGAGVTASRLRARGYGESEPVASNDTADGRQQNRRVEFEVTGL